MPIQLIARYRLDDAEHVGRRERDGYARLTAPPWEGGHETGIMDPAAAAELLPAAVFIACRSGCVGQDVQPRNDELAAAELERLQDAFEAATVESPRKLPDPDDALSVPEVVGDPDENLLAA